MPEAIRTVSIDTLSTRDLCMVGQRGYVENPKYRCIRSKRDQHPAAAAIQEALAVACNIHTTLKPLMRIQATMAANMASKTSATKACPVVMRLMACIVCLHCAW